jgi:hypothetical protein
MNTTETNGMVSVPAERLRKLEAMEAKAKLSARKATVKNLIFVEKAKAAGITVSKAEVEARIAEEDARKASATNAQA